MRAVEQLKAVVTLNIETNPFASGAGHRIGRPVQMAFGEVVRQIGLEAPLIIVAGAAGTGKTLLLDMIERSCADMGLSVKRVDRGDLLQMANGERTDLLLVDEAHAISDLTLRALFPANGRGPAASVVLLGLPSSTRRLSVSGVQAVVVELTPLSDVDARAYLLERASHAGLPQLFEPGALEPIVYAGRGLPRMLRSIASLAYFSAASDGEAQISLKHVAYALASQLSGDIPVMREETAPAGPEAVKAATPTTGDMPSAAASASLLTAVKSEASTRPVSLIQRAAGWTKRFAGVAVALTASLTVAAVIPSLLVGTSPDAVNGLNNRPVLPATYDVPKLPPRPARPAVASVNPQQPAVAPRNAARPSAARPQVTAPAASVSAPVPNETSAAPVATANSEPAGPGEAPAVATVMEPAPVPLESAVTKSPAEPELAETVTPPVTAAETTTAGPGAPPPLVIAPAAVVAVPPSPAPGIVGSLVTPEQVAEQARLAREAAARAQVAKDAAERAAATREQQTNRRRDGAFFTSMWGVAAPF